ncbi:hypothetical protein Anapl_00346 [Anas platyrhynchos]|uniref:Secreted protein n=1 Tax=Anas platyrhynchos TaxID=8839 RepID=R0LHC7_ANAPL|nr:hypothetical protein Anapl_00346 [Anas platyrhynchos]
MLVLLARSPALTCLFIPPAQPEAVPGDNQTFDDDPTGTQWVPLVLPPSCSEPQESSSRRECCGHSGSLCPVPEPRGGGSTVCRVFLGRDRGIAGMAMADASPELLHWLKKPPGCRRVQVSRHSKSLSASSHDKTTACSRELAPRLPLL